MQIKPASHSYNTSLLLLFIKFLFRNSSLLFFLLVSNLHFNILHLHNFIIITIYFTQKTYFLMCGILTNMRVFCCEVFRNFKNCHVRTCEWNVMIANYCCYKRVYTQLLYIYIYLWRLHLWRIHIYVRFIYILHIYGFIYKNSETINFKVITFNILVSDSTHSLKLENFYLLY